MKYDIAIESWNKFLVEQDTAFTSSATDVQTAATIEKPKEVEQSEEEKKQTKIKSVKDLAKKYTNDVKELTKQLGLDYSSISPELIKMAQSTEVTESKNNKSGDRCTRIAKRKYDVWPSAYASGAVVRCRQGKIWKGISENATEQEIDHALLLEELEKIQVIEEVSLILEKDPKVGSGKKPKNSDRRLYTDENPKDTVSVKFSSVQDIKDTLSKESFKSKSHARQSQIINLIHQRVRVAYGRAKEPEVKARLKKALDYAEQKKEASKQKTKNLQEEQQNNQLNERCWKGYTQKGMKTMFGKKYPNCVKITKENTDIEEIEILEEEWSEKYKKSIDCKNPKGFSQKAHCDGRKKNESVETEETELDEAKKRDYKPNFSKEKEQGLHGWFARNDGKGWINCRTGGPCGRDSADKGGKYPACRPTKAQCKSAGRGPLSKKKSSDPISWTKKKKD